MKIKHFSGYGCVNATKFSKRSYTDTFMNPCTELIIDVYGNHEQGLVLQDAYDVYNWLAKRFDKKIKNYHDICGSFGFRIINHGYNPLDNGIDEEFCRYQIWYES